MSKSQDASLPMLSNCMTSQVFSAQLMDQNMNSPIQEPVSDSEVKPSSLKQDDQGLPYVCSTCSKSFMRKDNLKQHLKIHSGEKHFMCNTCQKFFTRKFSLYRHALTHLKQDDQAPVSDSEVKPSSSVEDRKLSFVCNICSKTFSRKDALTRHRKLHSEDKPFCCATCGKAFFRKSNLQRHIVIHSNPKIKHNCDKCNEVFSLKRDLLMHRKIHLTPKQHSCELCDAVFSRKFELLQHKKIHKSPKQYNCDQCSNVFNSKSKLIHHVRTLHPFSTNHAKSSSLHPFPTNYAMPSSSLKEALYEKVKHFERQNAFNVFSATKINSNEDNDKDFHIFFNSVKSDVLNELNYQMEEKKSIKWYATAQVIVSKISQEGDLETGNPYFRSKTIREFTNENLSTHIDDAFAKINESFEKFAQRGSGWTLDKILYLEVSSSKYSMP